MPNQDNQKSRGNGRTSRQAEAPLANLISRTLYRRMLGTSLAGLAVFSLAFILLPTLMTEASATNLVGVGANWAAISLTLDPDYEATQGGESPSLSAHGNVDFGEITPTAKASGVSNSSTGNVGTLEILKKTIRIDTTGNYYQVFLSMNDDNSNALLNTTNSYITVPAISSDGTNTGTWSSPAYFSSQGWGYAVTGDTEALALPTFFTASTASINSSLGNELTYANDESVYTGVKFSAVPLLSNPQQIYKNTTNIVGGFSDNNADTFNVYYGVMVNTDVLAGTYNNRIVYTALASAANLDEVSTNVYVERYIIAKDTEQEISFDLAASTVPSNITTANTHVYLVPHDEMLAAGENGYDIEQLAGYTNPASSYNECEITSLNIADNKSTILCTSPESSNGTADDLTNGTNGMFDYWIQIAGLNFNYISKTADESETVAYIGLQSTYEEENATTGEPETKNYVTEMQEMTGSVCQNTNMWGRLMNTSTRANDALIYDYRGDGGVTVDSSTGVVTTVNTALANTSVASEAVGLGTFVLADTRETVASGGMTISGQNYKTYLVRRYADGNCWMAQNLDLNLASFVGTQNLTPENTDLQGSGRAYWDPGKSAYDIAYALDNTVTTAQTSYFPVFATNRLGNAQAKQYLTNTEFGLDSTNNILYYWGTKCSAAGTCDPDATVQNTALSSIPRAYNNDPENASGQPTAIYYTGGTGATQYGIKTGTNTSNTSYGNPGLYHNVTTWSPETPNSSDNTIMLGTRYFGDYYNWYAATAETGSYDMATDTAASDSICPKGWKLPANHSVSTADSWQNLINATYRFITSTTTEGVTTYTLTIPAPNSPTSTSMRLLPLSIPFTGYYNWQAAALSYRGSGGYFWSSTSHSSNQTDAWALGFSGNVLPQNNSNKVYGLTIRCVARD